MINLQQKDKKTVPEPNVYAQSMSQLLQLEKKFVYQNCVIPRNVNLYPKEIYATSSQTPSQDCNRHIASKMRQQLDRTISTLIQLCCKVEVVQYHLSSWMR